MIAMDVILEVDGLKLDGRLYLPGEGDRTSCPALCICHGIPAGSPLDHEDGGYPVLAERICYEGFAVFILTSGEPGSVVAIWTFWAGPGV